MYRGPRPPAQPRTLREIAETKGTVPAGFVEDVSDPVTHLPPGFPSAGQTYVDPESSKHVTAGTKKPIGPNPFASVRRGR